MTALAYLGDVPHAAEEHPPLRVWLVDALCFTPWYTAELSQALRGAGTELRLICAPNLKEPEFFLDQCVEIDPQCSKMYRRFGRAPSPIRRIARNVDVWQTMQRLITEIETGKNKLPDVIHLQQTPLLHRKITLDIKLVEAAKRAAVPVVHTVHNVLPHDTGDRQRSSYEELYSGVDHLICHDVTAMRRLHAEFAIPINKITVIGHGPLFTADHAPTDREISDARRRLGLPEQAAIVLWQGILAPYKGVDVLLEAWKLALSNRLQDTCPSPLLLVAGSGQRELEAATLLASRQIGSSIRSDLRYIRASELPLYYKAADILAYPYRSITTSGALLTGLSYAKPIVASDLPAFAEHLENGKNSLLVEPGNVEQLGAALRTLLEGHAAASSGDTGSKSVFYSQLKASALKNTSRYSNWKAIAADTLDMYRRCIADCRR